MIVAPKRGSFKRFGVTWRWCIEVATMRDIDDLEHGTRCQSRAVLKRIVVTSLWSRLFCADKIKADLDSQLAACMPPIESNAPPSGRAARNLLIRNCLEITRNTGLTATDIYERLSFVEFLALWNHCDWSQSVDHNFYASQSGKGAILTYPPIRQGGSNAPPEIDTEHLDSVLNAWQNNPQTVH